MMIRHVVALCALVLLGVSSGWIRAAEATRSDDYRDRIRAERSSPSRTASRRGERDDRYESRSRSRSAARRREIADRDDSRRVADSRDRAADDGGSLRRDRYAVDRQRQGDRDTATRYSAGSTDRDYLRRRVAQLPGEIPPPEYETYESLEEPQSVRLGAPVFGMPGAEPVPPPYSTYTAPAQLGYGPPPPGAYGPPPSGGAFFSPAAWGQPGCPAHCGPKYGVSMFGDFLYLSPRGVAVPFAVPTDGIGFVGTVPKGPTGSINPDYSPGFRVGGALIIAPCARIMGSYTWLQTNTNDSLTAPAGTVIDPLTAYPGTFNAGFQSDPTTAFYNINLQIADASYETLLVNTERSWLGIFGGGAYARLGQQFGANYPFAPPNGRTNVNTSVDFNGGGLQLGLEGEQRIWKCYGFRVYGRGLSRFLVGKFQSSYTQTNQFNGLEVSTSATDNRIVPVLDLELGVSWISPRSFVRLYGGYLISAWFNSVTTPGWIQSVHNESVLPAPAFLPATTNLTTLTFDGLVARVEVAF
ncbi:MAG: hypothetical protein K2Y37_01615 [Pirellulales bacterium]|nr:hypothetical protein [Pirellulales bacterium]